MRFHFVKSFRGVLGPPEWSQWGHPPSLRRNNRQIGFFISGKTYFTLYVRNMF